MNRILIKSNKSNLTSIKVFFYYQFGIVLKKSLKITLKSATKQKNQILSLDKYIPLPTNRLSKSIVQSKPIKSNNLKNQIDGRLNKVYGTIAKYSQIKLGDCNSKNKKSRSKSNLVLDSKYKRNPFEVINQKNPQIYKQLPYQLIKKYISSIYDQYQLRDPLVSDHTQSTKTIQQSFQIKQHQTPIKNNRLQSYRTSTKKKILVLKNNFINELNDITKRKQKLNLSTPRKLITQLNANQSSYNQHSKSSSKGIGLSTKKKININLHSQQPNLNQESLSFQNQISYFQNFNNNQIIQQKQKYFNQTLGQTKFTSSQVNFGQNTIFSHNALNDSMRFNKTMGFMQKNKKVKQIFRYCFVCQQPILQINMSHHEKQCQGLNKMLNDNNLTIQKLLKLIDQKIKKLQKQLQQAFLKADQKQTASKLSTIKQNVIQWIRQINSTQQQRQQIQNRKRLQEYQRINQAIKGTKIIKSFELLNKLNWFVHLKMNFLKDLKRCK